MNTDRELLELAAKACGWEWHPVGSLDKHASGWLDPVTGDPHWGDIWNPLTSDGDALRLAVALKFRVNVDAASTKVVYYPAAGADELEEAHNGDPCAATRRAIVRAAAAIGASKAEPAIGGMPLAGA